MTEHIYYNQGGVKITTSRAFFGGQIFAINGMTSVRMARVTPDQSLPLMLIIFGACLPCPCGVVFLA